MAITILICRSSRADNDPAGTAYPIISAYIYNFTQLTTWPADAISKDFTVCVLGEDPFGSALDPMASKMVNNKKIIIERYSRRDDNLSACTVLFIANSESANVETILAQLREAPVLTISDIEGFSDRGGMVELKLENSKVSMWIDLSAVHQAGIDISSKLLSLAHVKE